jgi:very-short-patch-repair endonuclease
MGKIYNRQKDTEKRKLLRNNMTKAEALLWAKIKGRKIEGHKFRRQFGVGAYVVDFYCPQLKLAMEVDGPTHLSDEEIEYDKNRQTEIEDLNIEFLRFTNDEIYKDLYNVVERIKERVIFLKAK